MKKNLKKTCKLSRSEIISVISRQYGNDKTEKNQIKIFLNAIRPNINSQLDSK